MNNKYTTVVESIQALQEATSSVQNYVSLIMTIMKDQKDFTHLRKDALLIKKSPETAISLLDAQQYMMACLVLTYARITSKNKEQQIDGFEELEDVLSRGLESIYKNPQASKTKRVLSGNLKMVTSILAELKG